MTKVALRFACLAFSCAALAVAGNEIRAQGYPNRTIRMVVPYPAGGTANDMRARIIADKLTQSLGKQVLVENKPGADGAIGTELVAKAAPDGHTLLLTVHATLLANPVLFKKMRYDPVNDFEHITQIITTTVILAVNPSLPVGSVKELIALAKAKPGQLNYATAASAFYLVTEMFKLRTGADMVYVPYKGAPPATMALLSGESPVIFSPLQTLLPLVKANKVRALAVASAARSPVLPDTPTMAESGLPGFEVSTVTGFAAPAGTPKEIVRILHDEIVKIVRMPEVRERLEGGGDTIIGSTPEEFTAFIKAEIERDRIVVREAGIPLIDQ
ncbi:MAG: tripartite tricarboxylate transporter substrate binding protein [Betaproteobacteria bacterium]|nr:tripartite tricarboxylate transporter substrate binding protein [Betaproteobacteria bacterium]